MQCDESSNTVCQETNEVIPKGKHRTKNGILSAREISKISGTSIGASVKRLPYATCTEKLTYREVGDIVGRSGTVVGLWVARHKCSTVEDIIARQAYLEEHTGRSARRAAPFVPPSLSDMSCFVGQSDYKKISRSFDSNKHCKRQDALGFVTHTCVRYSECGDSRAFEGSHSKHYLENGTCYNGERLKVKSVWEGNGMGPHMLANAACNVL